MKAAAVEPGDDPMDHEDSGKQLQRERRFLPPGRIRSRTKSGSSNKNEATKMAAKIAR